MPSHTSFGSEAAAVTDSDSGSSWGTGAAAAVAVPGTEDVAEVGSQGGVAISATSALSAATSLAGVTVVLLSATPCFFEAGAVPGTVPDAFEDPRAGPAGLALLLAFAPHAPAGAAFDFSEGPPSEGNSEPPSEGNSEPSSVAVASALASTVAGCVAMPSHTSFGSEAAAVTDSDSGSSWGTGAAAAVAVPGTEDVAEVGSQGGVAISATSALSAATSLAGVTVVLLSATPCFFEAGAVPGTVPDAFEDPRAGPAGLALLLAFAPHAPAGAAFDFSEGPPSEGNSEPPSEGGSAISTFAKTAVPSDSGEASTTDVASVVALFAASAMASLLRLTSVGRETGASATNFASVLALPVVSVLALPVPLTSIGRDTGAFAFPAAVLGSALARAPALPAPEVPLTGAGPTTVAVLAAACEGLPQAAAFGFAGGLVPPKVGKSPVPSLNSGAGAGADAGLSAAAASPPAASASSTC